ncbi:invasion associated locus B family protein [Lichenibacterium ramalinae]|uniref:Invasion associated locus B family protein n=1 Tax=Lichenibacterium ramalinae TaxID=2316527 RepID=A0A4Q2R7V0_9HYPH|nr:invasion associated locus B family protein [Lichenibacterium ramalinae]RYB02812.1 invasion associated locus B family protein [Lichenibacterium ramalinae]
MPIQPMKLGAAALLAGALIAAQAQAQTAAPAPAGAAPQGQPQNPSGPARIEMKTVEKSNWTKVCPKMQPGAKEMCLTTRDFTVAADQPPLIALALYDVKGEDARDIRLLLPNSLLLKPGVRLSVDKGAVVDASYSLCMPNGCFAETRIKGSFLDQMKKGTTFNVAVKGPANNEITFALPLANFGKAVDGPAIPQEEIVKQQQAMQAELQKQLEQRAEAQRKALESQPAAPAAAGAAPATPAPAPAAKP